MDSSNRKHFVEGERVSWELSPYNKGLGAIRGKVEGLPSLDEVDDEWWIVELEWPREIGHYGYSCIAVPSYRLDSIDKQMSLSLPQNS